GPCAPLPPLPGSVDIDLLHPANATSTTSAQIRMAGYTATANAPSPSPSASLARVVLRLLANRVEQRRHVLGRPPARHPHRQRSAELHLEAIDRVRAPPPVERLEDPAAFVHRHPRHALVRRRRT